MKRLINKKTNEILYLNLSNNTIYSSKTKTTNKISISKNTTTHKITKITILNSEPISEPTPIPTTQNETKTTSKPTNTNKSHTSTPTHHINNIISSILPQTLITNTLFFNKYPFYILNPLYQKPIQYVLSSPLLSYKKTA